MGFILFMQKANKHSLDFGVNLLVSPEVHPHVSEAIHSWMKPAGDGDAGLVYAEPHTRSPKYGISTRFLHSQTADPEIKHKRKSEQVCDVASL